MDSIQHWASTMAPEDKQFYKDLGKRIAVSRKELELTQTQLAERLGIAQQTMAHYEGGSLRIAVALLKPLSHILDIRLDELIDEPATSKKSKRGPAPKLQQQIEQISLMPRAKQKFITEMLDALIQQQQQAS